MMRVSTFAALQARIFSRIVVFACGASVVGIGSTTLIGYSMEVIYLYRWSAGSVGMAPNTALGFILTGIGIAVLGASDRVWRCN